MVVSFTLTSCPPSIDFLSSTGESGDGKIATEAGFWSLDKEESVKLRPAWSKLRDSTVVAPDKVRASFQGAVSLPISEELVEGVFISEFVSLPHVLSPNLIGVCSDNSCLAKSVKFRFGLQTEVMSGSR